MGKNKQLVKTKPQSIYLWSMENAIKPNENHHWFQTIPIVIFSSVIILVVQMATYKRPLEQFFWFSGDEQLNDFFSYYKMVGVLICAAFVILIILYRLFIQALSIRKSVFYIPMIVYSAFVLLSYLFSDYKEFALWGWNDRFEGTLVIVAYMLMLFYIINTINGERCIKVVLYGIGVSSLTLGLLGITQAIDKDFFQTSLGQKLITPNVMTDSGYTVNELIEQAQAAGRQFLNFTFLNKEIYQTVYNINYVSFYLTLLIPLFAFILIYLILQKKNVALYKKVVLSAFFGILMFNIIGSASSSGFLGMFASFIIALIVLRKQVISWIKPLTILLLIVILVGGITYQRWMPEIVGAAKSVAGKDIHYGEDVVHDENYHRIDFLITSGNAIHLGVEGNELVVETFPEDPLLLEIKDSEGNTINLLPTETSPIYTFDDSRFDFCLLQPAQSEDGSHFIILSTDQQEKNWVFRITNEGVLYNNELGNTLKLEEPIPAIGWESNQGFGNGRGYIWSRTIPLFKDTIFLGHGADTYCIYFPHDDYVGKYNAGWNINLIVDKPHNMYMGMWIGTGAISLLAYLTMLSIYLIQSVRLYRKVDWMEWMQFVGFGIALGIIGFSVAGVFNDSSVSVMPLFYSLLGLGITINQNLSTKFPKRS